MSTGCCVGCVHGSLGYNYIGDEGGAAIVGALRHVPLLTHLKYVVGEGASHEAVGEAVMVGGLGRRCVCWADVKWLRVFGRLNAVQWEARGMC
jgi:hypothetical protein